MAIDVVHDDGLQRRWVPIKPSATVYVGSIVCMDSSAIATDEGVIVRGQADGIADVDNKDIPLGVVVGTNLRTPVYDSTYQANKITDEGVTGPATSTVDYTGVEGPFIKGEKRAMVEIIPIYPHTVLRAPIRNNAIGTAPSLLTSTSSGSKVTMTTNAADFAPIAGLGTIFFRTGGNAGIYRQTDDTSTTVAAYDVNTPANSAVGDTAVRAPVTQMGSAYVRLGDDTVCSYLNCSETPATNYDIINVIRLDLSVAGEEYVEFTFDPCHFSLQRALST